MRQEFVKALDDATVALSLEPDSVKSLLRRAAAANALGRHRAAVEDLSRALELEPRNKQVGSILVVGGCPVCGGGGAGGTWMLVDPC